jgi:putative hydrolase of the HAD superfamily
MTIRALVLDYGGVLSLPQRDNEMARMARRIGVPLDEFRRAYREHRDDYDAGLAADEYWRRVLSRVSPSERLTPSMLAALVEDDIASWGYPCEEMWDISLAFRSSGGRTALLTNNVSPFMAHLRGLGRLETHFDVILASCELGVCKPDPRIFRACLQAIAVPPDETLFVDDHPPNVDEARRQGLQTLLFEGDRSVEALRDTLALRA